VTTGTPSITPIPSSGSFTVAATVTMKPPAQGPVIGMVRFEVNGQPWGDGPVSIQDGEAISAPISGLPVGSHTITVAYLGTDELAPSGTNFLVVVTPQGRRIVVAPHMTQRWADKSSIVSDCFLGAGRRLRGCARRRGNSRRGGRRGPVARLGVAAQNATTRAVWRAGKTD
jgi:hypothetical protein